MLDNNTEVSIPDKKLSRIIHRILKKQDTESIIQSEMESILNINVFNQGIKDLTGLEYAANLEGLIISFNAIDNLEPLRSCTKLKKLTAKYLITSSISSLPSNLEQLDITNIILTGSDDFSSLATLTKLQQLNISNTPLDSIAFVADIPNLAYIEANNCKVTNLKPLQPLLDSGLLNSSYSLKDQAILLDQRTVGTTTALALHKPDGEAPSITWVTAGSYDNEKEQLTWENNGYNSLSWSYSAENNERITICSGEVSQFNSEDLALN